MCENPDRGHGAQAFAGLHGYLTLILLAAKRPQRKELFHLISWLATQATVGSVSSRSPAVHASQNAHPIPHPCGNCNQPTGNSGHTTKCEFKRSRGRLRQFLAWTNEPSLVVLRRLVLHAEPLLRHRTCRQSSARDSGLRQLRVLVRNCYRSSPLTALREIAWSGCKYGACV